MNYPVFFRLSARISVAPAKRIGVLYQICRESPYLVQIEQKYRALYMKT